MVLYYCINVRISMCRIAIIFLSFGQKGLGKQCRPRSECFWRSSLIRVYTVCHSICTFWTHYSVVEPPCSNFRVITANFSGVQNFRIFTVRLKCLDFVVCLEMRLLFL